MASRALGEIALGDEPGVVRLPALLKGELVRAGRVSLTELRAAAAAAGARPSGPFAFRHGDAQVLREPDGSRFVVFPRPRPEALLETDASALASGLFALPFPDVLDFASALGEVLRSGRSEVTRTVQELGGGTLLDPRLLAFTFELAPALFDRGPLAEAVDRELGGDGHPGRDYLDGWVELEFEATRGVTARRAEAVLGPAARGPGRLRPSVRAVPTRQLHVTAGNSPLILLLSFLRGLLTKGACVVKSPAEACAVGAALAAALHAVDPRHPITRHTSVLYWPGGDRGMEDTLLAPGAFDRLVVWGSAETVRSVRERAPMTKTIAFNPRYGVSLIGGQAHEAPEEAAARASADTLIWEQQACTASLVHYVEGGEADALAYCRALAAALAQWDRERGRPLPRAAQGRLRLLRRGEWLDGTWFENRTGDEIGSAVVYMPRSVDLSRHPMSRLAVVRRVERLEQAIPLLSGAVACAGVYPDPALPRLRDALAAAGVSAVFPLGECERAYPGMPHDGMRVLSELVSWASSGTDHERSGR